MVYFAGVDEAGRGPLAGPVVAAAVILPEVYDLPDLTDSKKLSPKKREALFEAIKEVAVAYAIAESSVSEIDTLNILQASLLAMHRAVKLLPVQPTKVWVDGNQLPRWPYESEAVIEGDRLIPAISAASILAKVTRDRMMANLHVTFPQYEFLQHKGYPTKLHIDRLEEHGVSVHHRCSFAPVRRVLEKVEI